MVMMDLLQGHKDGSVYTDQTMWYTTVTKGKKKITWSS